MDLVILPTRILRLINVLEESDLDGDNTEGKKKLSSNLSTILL